MILKFQLFDVSCFLMHMPILFISDWLNFSSLFFFFFFLNMYLWKILLREVFMLTLMPFEMNITAKGGMKLNQYFHYVQKCENVFNELAKKSHPLLPEWTYNKNKFSIQKIVLVYWFICFFLLPFVFVALDSWKEENSIFAVFFSFGKEEKIFSASNLLINLLTVILLSTKMSKNEQ